MFQVIKNLSDKAILGGFCEKQNQNFPVEFWNSLSNIGYIIIAIVLALSAKKDKIYSLLIVWVGVSSFLYHSIFLRGYQILDLTAINLILAYIFFRLLKYSAKSSFIISILLCIGTFVMNLVFPEHGRFFVIIFVVPTIMLLVKVYKRRSFEIIFIFLVAWIFWLLDGSGVFIQLRSNSLYQKFGRLTTAVRLRTA